MNFLVYIAADWYQTTFWWQAAYSASSNLFV